MHTDHGTRKVLLIGWDAADWKVIMPLIDHGKLPNLARLMEGGICGNIATLQPVISPILWTSIATGKRAYKHGIHGFAEPDPLTGSIRAVTNLSRKTKAIWNILNQNDLNTITIGWWPSNPVEELSKGVMVSNDYQQAIGKDPKEWPLKPGTIHPARLRKTLAELRFHPTELTEAELLPFVPGLKGMDRQGLDKAEKDRRMQMLLKIIADCTSIHSAATALIQTEPWDFMAVYYDAIDHFGHAFMRYHPPKQDYIDDWDFRVFNYCLEGGYIYHDMMLGTLLRLAGKDTTVILLSDHGFHPDHLRAAGLPREPAGPAVEHRQFGIFVAKGPDIKKDERVYGANLLDICPTLLHLFGLPVAEDMDGKVLLDIYEGKPDAIERVPSWDDIEGDHGMHPRDKQISPADSKAALQQLVALGYIAEPNADKAKALEETVRELDYHLAQAYMDGGIYNQAVDMLERLYGTWPNEHRFGFKLAGCYQSLGRTADLRLLVTTLIERRIEEANTAAATLRSLNLDDPEAQKADKERIEKMNERQRQRFVAARRELRAKARPNLFSLRYLEACADFAEKKYEGALTKLEQLDSDYGARRNALVLRGEICQRLKRWKESKSAFDEALEIDPESPGPLLGLARNALAAKEYGAAAQYARESIGLLFFQPRAHYIHGLAQYRLGFWEEAEHAFLLCIHQAPLFSAAFRMLAETARLYKRDPAEQAVYQVKALETRHRLAELRKQKTAPNTAGTVNRRRDIRPMPQLKQRPEALVGVAAKDIITVVSGLPRSGTSLMMQILEATGIQPFTDSKRTADDSNPKGYYEHTKATTLLSDSDRSWITDAKGKAIKVVAPLLANLPIKVKKSESQIEALHYRILFLERDMEEILQSQKAMLQRLGKLPEVASGGGDVTKVFRQQERYAKGWCLHLGITAMSVNFHDLVHNSEKVLPELARFLGVTDKLSAMQGCIDPALHRERKNPHSKETGSTKSRLARMVEAAIC
jgi:tetratricopeptide (TPR) repeat protein